MCLQEKIQERTSPPYGYIESKLRLVDIPYKEYGYDFSEEFKKRAIVWNGDWVYVLQTNAIHSPDSVDSYIRETICLKSFLK